jgi:hypothetical protein
MKADTPEGRIRAATKRRRIAALQTWMIGAVAVLSSSLVAATSSSQRALLLVSIDGLRPAYVLEADKHGLKVPHLSALAREGSYALGVRGVGFAPSTKVLWLDAAFVKAGLMTLKGKGITAETAGISDWIARPWHAGGSAAIVMKNTGDADARTKVKALLDTLAADPENGIAAVLNENEIREMGAMPTAQFWVTMRAGFQLSATLQPSIVSVVSARGTHGHAPTLPEVAATFIIAGDGIAKNRNLGSIDMRSIAPTLARVMGVPFPSAELPAQNIFYAKE